MKKLLLNTAIIALFVSCSSKYKRQMIRDLTNDNFKYWYRYHKDTLKPYALGICFYKNGTFIDYINPAGDNTKRKVNYNPVLSKPIWKFINDSTMMFGENDIYRIVALTADSLILRNIKFPNRDYLKYHNDKDQFTKPQG